MKVKVCGITSFVQLQQLHQLKVDFAGMIFYEKSARFVGTKMKDDQSQIKKLSINKVGVFVHANMDAIKKAIEEYGLQYVQLHGNEAPDFCNQVQQLASVIKAIRINDETGLQEQLEQYQNACDYFLFDTDSKQYGGTGQQFNWALLHTVAVNKPFFLSGGIGVEDMEQLKAFHHADLFAVDVNSKLETAPGIKNMEAVKKFLFKL